MKETYFMKPEDRARAIRGLTPQQRAKDAWDDLQNCMEGGLLTDTEIQVRLAKITMLSHGIHT